MKKLKYIIVIAITVLIAITSLIIIKPYKRYRKGVIEKEITELLNTGKVGKDILSKDGAWYEYARNEDVHNHNIDEFVKWYLDFIERIVELKKTGKGIENLKDFKFKEKEFLDIEGYTNKDIYEEIINYITNEDIEKYNNSTLRNDLISILKRTFVHVGQDDYTGWYISDSTEKNFELPYNCYLKYIPTDKKNNDEFSKAIKTNIYDIGLISSKVKNYKPYLDYIDNLQGSDHILLKCNILYETNDNKTKKFSGGIELNKKQGNLKYSTYLILCSLLYKQSRYASIELCHHGIDKRKEEERRREEEMLKSKEDDAMHPEEILVDTKIKRIEMFKKYNQYAQIDVVTYKDGSKKSFFRKHTSYVNDEGRKIMRYMKRELPYKDVTIEEAYELYINDKEQYSIDEELLKGNQPLVEYISYEQ